MDSFQHEEIVRGLLHLDTNEWRALRAKVRWHYERWNLNPPRRLRRYFTQLPSDSLVWIEIAREVTALRRNMAQNKKRASKKLEKKRRRDRRREYMRDYMKVYRSR